MSPFENAMQDVLSRSRYNTLTGRAVDFRQMLFDAVERVVSFILKRLNMNFPNLSDYNTALITRVVLVIAVCIALAVVAVALRVILKRRRRTILMSDIFDGLDGLDPASIAGRTPEEMLTFSHARAREKLWRDALRYYYIAVLLDLNEKEFIRIEKSKTNAQLQRELAKAVPELDAPFSVLVDIFHLTWFGRKGADADRYAQFEAIALTLRKWGAVDHA